MKFALSKIVVCGLVVISIASLNAAISLPALQDPDGAVNNISGYKNYNWYEYDGWNGAIHSPEYVAYNYKYLPIANNASIVRLKGGTPDGSGWFSYVILNYTSNGNCIHGGYFTWPNGYYGNSKDITSPRIRGCTGWGLPSWCGADYATDIANCSSSTPMSIQSDLASFLTSHLTALAYSLIDTTRFCSTQIAVGIRNSRNLRNYYNQLWQTMANDNRVTSYSVGTLGHYYALVNELLTRDPHPMSDTSDVMFFSGDTEAASYFARHPLYLYFSANVYARNLARGNANNQNLLALALLMHRFRSVWNTINVQTWKQNPDLAKAYEVIALVRILNPNAANVPSLASWVDASSAANAFESLSPDQFGAIANAANNINNAIPDEIGALESDPALFTVGQLFNWSTHKATV